MLLKTMEQQITLLLASLSRLKQLQMITIPTNLGLWAWPKDDFKGLTPVKISIAIDEEKDKDYEGNVRVAAVGAGDLQLWAYSEDDEKWFDINDAGWGPPDGFPIDLAAETDVYVVPTATFEKKTITLKLEDITGDYGATDNIISQEEFITANLTVVLDTFSSEGIPDMEGTLTTDGENLFLEVSADPMAVSGNNAYMAWLIYTGDAEPEEFAGPWDDAYLLNDNWFSAGPQGNVRWGVGSGSSHPWGNQGALPSGVELDYEVAGDVGIWTMTVPYDVIGVEKGDTISYMAQARYQDSENRFEDVNLFLNQSHGGEGFNPLYFSENFQEVVVK